MAPSITESIADFLERVARCRWLEPDSDFAAVTPAASRAIEERVDEYAAALERLAPGGLDAPRVRVTRSAPEACARWTAAWREEAARGASALDATGALRGLDAAVATTRFELAELVYVRAPGGTNPRSATRMLADALATAAARSDRWQLGVAGRGHRAPPGAHALAALHAAWLAHRDTRAAPSPWLPLFALWERGAWPLVLPGHEVLVYIAVHDEGGLVPDPDRPDVRALPAVPEDTPPAALIATARLGALGLGPPPCADRALPAALLVGRGREGGWRVPITARATTIGRSPENAVVVWRDSISRRHAVVTFERGRFWLTDRESTSGSYVNEVAARGPTPIAPGDALRLGGVQMTLEVPRT